MVMTLSLTEQLLKDSIVFFYPKLFFFLATQGNFNFPHPNDRSTPSEDLNLFYFRWSHVEISIL